jgi:hypothetical protein
MNMLVQNHYKYMLVHYLFPNIHQLQFWFGEKKRKLGFFFFSEFPLHDFQYICFVQSEQDHSQVSRPCYLGLVNENMALS